SEGRSKAFADRCTGIRPCLRRDILELGASLQNRNIIGDPHISQEHHRSQCLHLVLILRGALGVDLHGEEEAPRIETRYTIPFTGIINRKADIHPELPVVITHHLTTIRSGLIGRRLRTLYHLLQGEGAIAARIVIEDSETASSQAENHGAAVVGCAPPAPLDVRLLRTLGVATSR